MPESDHGGLRPLTAPEIDLGPEARAALGLIGSDCPMLFILGRAGTGKTTLVRYLRNLPGADKMVVLAPTGIAAINAGGQTIHSFFRLPPRLLDPENIQITRSNKLWRKVDRIVIDEVSMVRVDMIDAMDVILRRARRDERPFGGVQMIFVGDFLQLPPVTPGPESEMLRQLGYASPFAFSARAVCGVGAETGARYIALDTVHRQKDPEFIEILGKLRSGRNIGDALQRLNDRCVGPHRETALPMLLTGTNARATRYNLEGLRAIGEESMVYGGVTTGTLEKERGRLPVPETLELKPGARVMAVKNDPGGRWVNGSLGTVWAVEDRKVRVRFDHDPVIADVEPQTWESFRYEWDEEANRVKAEIVGSFKQIPLILAWAATIHKAQGLTLEDVRVDLEGGAFASGQAYVAISRARSLEGLSLTRPLRPNDFRIDPMLAEFDRWAISGDNPTYFGESG
ncbi:MAG: AAA family ATPase [Fimbriimonadaceae bacterium]|nr:AAA family ATPase [Alphaproteobacteria bacterium]